MILFHKIEFAVLKIEVTGKSINKNRFKLRRKPRKRIYRNISENPEAEKYNQHEIGKFFVVNEKCFTSFAIYNKIKKEIKNKRKQEHK